MLLFKKEKKEKKPKPIKVSYDKKNKSPIYQLIAFSIREELAGRVILGKREDEIFICYKNEQLVKFFNDWFGIQRLRRDKELSDEMYSAFIQGTLQTKEKISSENE